MKAENIILIITAFLTALVAGLFFAWSVSITLGLLRVSDSEYVSVMQATNRAIQNPVFFAAFFGAPLFLIISTIIFYGDAARFPLLLAAALVFLTGTFGLTIAGNVPMNNALDRFDAATATDEEVLRQRNDFERRWTLFNHIRAAAATISLILVTIACLD